VRRLLPLLLILMSPVALASPGSPASAPVAVDASVLLQDIDRLIGEPRCSVDTQCRSLPLGQRACGGPELYRAYAVGPAEQRLLDLAQQHRQARQAQQRSSGRVGICQLLADPGARCDLQRQRCVLRDPP
jgi:hypothetical protein